MDDAPAPDAIYNVEASVRHRDPKRQVLPGRADYWVNVAAPDIAAAPAAAAQALRTYFRDRHPDREILILTTRDAVAAPDAAPGVIEITHRPV